MTEKESMPIERDKSHVSTGGAWRATGRSLYGSLWTCASKRPKVSGRQWAAIVGPTARKLRCNSVGCWREGQYYRFSLPHWHLCTKMTFETPFFSSVYPSELPVPETYGNVSEISGGAKPCRKRQESLPGRVTRSLLRVPKGAAPRPAPLVP